MEFEFDDTGGGEEPPEEFGDTMINSGIDLPQGEMPEDDLELSGDSDLLDVPGGEIPGAREGMEEGELLGVDTVSFDTSEEMVELEDPFSTTGGVLDEFVEQDLPTDLFETPSESVAFETQHEDTEFETPTEHSGFDVSQDMEPSLDMEPTSDMGTPPGMKTPGFVEEVGDEEHDMRVDDDIDFHELKAPSKPPEMEDRPLGIHEEFDDDDFPEDMPEDDEDLLLRMGENDEVSDDEGVSITTETIADIYVKQGHFDKAQGIYEELCHAYPENESLREKLGHVQMRIASGQTEESRQNEIAPDTDMSPEDTQQSERAIERLNTWLEDIQKRRRGVP